MIGDNMKSVNAYELNGLIQNNEDFTLLDVREPHELEIAQIKHDVHIPMGQIPDRHSELDKGKRIIVMCHGGVRSARVCSYLTDHGFDAINFTGGISAWSREIDPSVTEY